MPLNNASVYDCTMFHWEFELLELRMKELWDVVDKFYVTECTYDHRGNSRDLVLSENIHMFNWAKEKLEVRVSEKPVNAIKTWDFENNHRLDSVRFPLNDFDPKENDLFIISDIDEIPSSKAIKKISGKEGLFTLKMKMYYFYLNFFIADWYFPRAVSYSHLKDPNILRMTDPAQSQLIENAGWHFSYLGDEIKLQYKIKTFAHNELDIPEFNNIENIRSAIKNKRDIFGRFDKNQFGPLAEYGKDPFQVEEIDESWPQFILNNKEKYSNFIL
jgi:beta-1,4-mannosyl-glycoprotein beta-1,4-N-acetylglucosaminyltransferase